MPAPVHQIARRIGAIVVASLVALAPGAAQASQGGPDSPARQVASAADVRIVYPGSGWVYAPGPVYFRGLGPTGGRVDLTLSGPGRAGEPGWEQRTWSMPVVDGGWELEPSLDLSGTYRLEVSSPSSSVTDFVELTVDWAVAIYVTSPVRGAVVSTGAVVVTGIGKRGSTVFPEVFVYDEPDGSMSFYMDRGTVKVDASGVWTMTFPISSPGHYHLSVRNIEGTSFAGADFSTVSPS